MDFPEDYTGTFGDQPDTRAAMDLLGPPPVTMFQYSRVASIFWNAFANTLRARGLSEQEVFDQMQSKGVRYMLDGDLSDKLERAAVEMANEYKILDLSDE